MKFAPYTSASEALVRERLIAFALSAPPESARASLVTAPAGYGKTTLLCQLREELARQGMRTAWLNCTAEDCGADVFIANLNSAFHTAGLTDSVTDYGVADLARTLSEKKPAALLIDEYENASSESSDNVLGQLIRSLPEDCRLIVATRELPKVGVTKLLLDGHVRVVEAAEMRFNDSETSHVIAGVDMPPSYGELIRQSEGWPVMLQLARLDAQSSRGVAAAITPRLGQSVGIFDYLADQILSKLDPTERDFLLELSVLTEVDIGSAQAVTTLANAEKLLYDLLSLRPVITVIEEDPISVRFHPLLRDFLRHESGKYPVTPAHELHRRAARYFAEKGNLSKAIQHAARTESNDLTAEILENAGGPLLTISEGQARVRSFLSALPPSFITQRPRLYLTRLLQQAAEGSSAEWIAEFEHFVDQVEKASPEMDDDLLMQLDIVRAMVEVVEDRHCLVEVPWKRIDEIRQKCLERKFEDPRYSGIGLPVEMMFLQDYGSLTLADERMDELTELFTSANFSPNFSWLSNHMSNLNLARGNLELAAHYARVCLDRVRDSGETRNTLMRQHCNAILGQCHYEKNELDLALEYFGKVNKTSAYSLIPTFVGAVCNEARIFVLRGETDRALASLEEIYAFTVREHLPHFRVMAAATIAELLLNAGDVEGCETWIASENLGKVLEKSQLWFTRPWIETGVLVRLFTLYWMHKGDLERAHDTTHEFATRARQSGRHLMAAHAECLLVEVALKQHRRAAAQMALTRALDDTKSSRALRPFLDLSSAALAVMRGMAKKKGQPHKDRIGAILDARDTSPDPQGTNGECVSPREKEVLIGLSQGHPTKIIARELDLSYETVRHHLKNIYAKLDVHDREQAVGEARRRSII